MRYDGNRNLFVNIFSVPLQPIEWTTRLLIENGKYSAFVVAAANATSLTPGSLIHCEMRIPGTGYVKRKALLYYPPGNYAIKTLN